MTGMWDRNTAWQLRRFYRPWYLRGFTIAAFLLGTLVVGRLALRPLVRRETQRALDEIPGWQASFRTIHVGLFPPLIQLVDLELTPAGGGGTDDRPASLRADLVEIRASVRALVRRRLDARVRVDRPRLILRATGLPAEPLPDLIGVLERRLPTRIEALQIHGGELVAVDGTKSGLPGVRLRDIDLEVTEVAGAPPAVGPPRPTTLHGSASVQRSGTILLEATAAPGVALSGMSARAMLRGLSLGDLYQALSVPRPPHTAGGAVDVEVDFTVESGRLSGTVHSRTRGLEAAPPELGAVTERIAALADQSLGLFPPESVSADGLLTMRAELREPTSGSPALFANVLRNALLAGVMAAVSQLPAERADPAVVTRVREPAVGPAVEGNR